MSDVIKVEGDVISSNIVQGDNKVIGPEVANFRHSTVHVIERDPDQKDEHYVRYEITLENQKVSRYDETGRFKIELHNQKDGSVTTKEVPCEYTRGKSSKGEYSRIPYCATKVLDPNGITVTTFTDGVRVYLFKEGYTLIDREPLEMKIGKSRLEAPGFENVKNEIIYTNAPRDWVEDEFDKLGLKYNFEK